MPIAVINIIEGRNLEKKRALIRSVTDAICNSLDAPVQSVRVIINEMPKENFAIAGELVCDREAAK
ncbi:MAG: 2-hydroxymuconate tautomerase [Synergistaceae bacterium]|nr:2-hydroxymuconate tautomerase [Synergistaceae bacterium]